MARIPFALLAGLVLFVPALVSSLPWAAETLSTAHRLRSLSWWRRRVEIVGPHYEAIRNAKATMTPLDRVAILMERDDSKTLKAAASAVYYFYPTPATLYRSHDAFLDSTFAGGPVTKAFGIDATRSPPVREIPLSETIAGAFPFVCSVKGRDGVFYRFRLEIGSSEETSFAVDVTFSSSTGQIIRRRLTIDPKSPSEWNDAVGEIFGASGVGWLQIRTVRPIHLRGWFAATRGATEAKSEIPFLPVASLGKLESLVVRSIPEPAEKLRFWIANFEGNPVAVRLSVQGDAGEHRVRSFPVGGQSFSELTQERLFEGLSSTGRFTIHRFDQPRAILFATRRGADGLETDFFWPSQRTP